MIKEKKIEIAKESTYLLESIDFFSQNLSFEQIITYGYFFVHDMLMLEHSGIFVLEGDRFQLKSAIEAEFSQDSFENTAILKNVATKFGRGMQRELKTYFKDDFIDGECISMAMPIIVKDQTLAYIISKSPNLILSDSGLASIFNGINQLLNKGAESAKNFEQYKEASTSLDRKIFNLLFINHSTKALMSEVNLERLYTLCIDVIRELTASSVTSFALYNEQKKNITLRGFKNILSFDEQYCELKLINESQRPYKAVYHIKDDYNDLGEIFENPDKFNDLKAEYVVLLIKEKVLGFVTIGATVSGKAYTDELLGQVESLISSIFIAIKNAQHILTINTQKDEIMEQFKSINQLNDAIKNINSCESIEELSHIALQTVAFGFGITKAMIVIKDHDVYKIKECQGCDHKEELFLISNDFREQCFDQTYFDAIKGDLSKLIDCNLLKDIGEHNCFISVPLSTSDLEIGEEPLGFLIAFESEHALQKSQIVTLEAIANSVAPIVNQMQEKHEILTTYIPNTKEIFLRKLDQAFEEREIYYMDFKVNYKHFKECIFETLDLGAYEGLDVDLINSMLFHISFGDDDHHDLFDGSIEAADKEDFKEKVKAILF